MINTKSSDKWLDLDLLRTFAAVAIWTFGSSRCSSIELNLPVSQQMQR